MNPRELWNFLRKHRYCVQATTSESGAPQAAVVGFAVSEQCEIVFDTFASTRKVANLRCDPRVALVVGWENEETVQIEGIADEPSGPELARLQQVYFEVFPEGRQRREWEGITYVRVLPTWARYSRFRGMIPDIVTFNEEDFGAWPTAGTTRKSDVLRS